MKRTKQILSVFLSVCMIISCMVGMSVTALAEGASVIISPSNGGSVSHEIFNEYNMDYYRFTATPNPGYRFKEWTYTYDSMYVNRNDNPLSVFPVTWFNQGEFVNFTAVFELIPPHTHSFTYSADGATITATCSAADCSLTGGKATLTIAAPALTTYGGTGDATATLTGLDAFNSATGKTIAATGIKYVGRADTTYAESATAPTGAGKYTAKITVEENTASVDYEIAKATPTINTAPTASAITYGQKLSYSTLSGGAASVDGTFAWKTPRTAPAVSDSDTTEYTVVFTPTDSTNYSTVETNVTLTVNKADPTVTAPTANTLTYTGSAQALVTGGSATGGTMQYSTTKTGTYSETIPTGTAAGDYTVWYKVVGDANHDDIAAEQINVSIAKADSSVTTAPAAKELTYNGEEQELVTAGTAEGGRLIYGTNGTHFGENIPTGTDAGDYTVYYMVDADDNHNDTEAVSINVTVAKAESSVTSAPTAKTGLTATGSALALVNSGTAEGGEMQYSLDGVTYSAYIPTATAAGTYTVYYKVIGDKNHNDTEAQTVTAAIAPLVNPTPYIPPYVPSGTSTTTTTTTTDTTPDISKLNIRATETAGHGVDLAWDTVPGASGYTLSVKIDNKFVVMQNVSSTFVDVVYGSNGKYYVSEGGDYTIYEYNEKTGKLVKTGTLKSNKIDSIVKANNVTLDFMVQYTRNGMLSAEKDSYKISKKIYYKPALKLTTGKNSTTGKSFIRLKWAKVDGATKYRVYKLVNGKLRLVTETTKCSVRINGTESGRNYTYSVSACVNGEWTILKKSDRVSITAK